MKHIERAALKRLETSGHPPRRPKATLPHFEEWLTTRNLMGALATQDKQAIIDQAKSENMSETEIMDLMEFAFGAVKH